MKLTTLLVSAVLALGVAAIDPEAGNNVEVRDFSGESLNEFDARDEEDLEARGDYAPKCKGKYVVWKKVDYDWKCVCTRKGEIYNKYTGCACKDGEVYSDKFAMCIPKCSPYEPYNPKTGKCEKPFTCKGDNVKVIVDNYGQKSCKCLRTGEEYNPKFGCACKRGEEYSEKYAKCIPDCKDYEEYNDKTGKCEKPFSCKGKNVKVEVDGYGAKYCKCELEGQVYNKWRGCECKDGEILSDKYHKCIPKCGYGTVYDGQKCSPICKGDYVVFKKNECKCLKPGYYYDKSYGCKPRCDGDGKWNGHECTCDYGKDYVKGTGCVDKCKKPAYFKKNECVCPAKDQYYVKDYGCKERCEAENTHWNGHKCVCDRGTVSHGGKCVIPPTCKGYGSYFDLKSWKCVCKAKGENYVEGKGCVKQCGPNEKLVWNYGQAKCECKDGYVKTKWGCKEKTYGQY